MSLQVLPPAAPVTGFRFDYTAVMANNKRTAELQKGLSQSSGSPTTRSEASSSELSEEGRTALSIIVLTVHDR